MGFYYTDKIKIEIVEALKDLNGKARFNEIKNHIDEARKRRHVEKPIKRLKPKRISTSTLTMKLEELERSGKIKVVRFSKNKVEYLFRSTGRFNTEYALGDVIVSLADVLRLIGVSNPLNTSILAMQEMKPKDFKLMLKFLKKIEQRFARTRSQIERYLQYQSQF